MRIIVVSPNFREERFRKRWKQFADAYVNHEITLISPKIWEEGRNKSYTFGRIDKYVVQPIFEGNCRLVTINIRISRVFGWLPLDINSVLRRYQPDVVYYIGHHEQKAAYLFAKSTKKVSPNSKFVLFSMRGLPKRKISFRNRPITNLLIMLNNHYSSKTLHLSDGLCVHYPRAKELFVEEGYSKPILINTQIGVDADFFCPEGVQKFLPIDVQKSGNSLFVTASRFSEEKGIDTIIRAISKVSNTSLVILGSGTDKQIARLKSLISELGIGDRVQIPGYVEWDALLKYLRLADCYIHYPMTTDFWVETFSLSLVQAMSVGLPIIGSDSGSVPFQVGEAGIICKENDKQSLENAIRRFLCLNVENRQKMANQSRIRAISLFSYQTINHDFKEFIEKIVGDQGNEIK